MSFLDINPISNVLMLEPFGINLGVDTCVGGCRLNINPISNVLMLEPTGINHGVGTLEPVY